MPPPTPRTTWGRRSAGGVPVTSVSSLAFGVLEQAGVDLAERDRQRLLARTRLHQRADVLEQALAELRVVVVDLAGALGRVDHQGVLRADLVEQVVDRGVGDAFELRARRVTQCAQLGGGDHSCFSSWSDDLSSTKVSNSAA